MYEIRIKSNFSAAHNLRNYRGKCEKLHGHNWVCEAAFSYKALDKNGLAVDFRHAKKMLKCVLEKLDHSYLNDLGSFKRSNPTSENIAKFIYDSLKLKNKHLKSVLVWENENSCALFAGEGEDN
ncbi:MAG: 6-carboxytetrahydropterin synthase QueD [Candidatus Omnitrophota bacterium]|nr:6-carboxytetrahydropterin synthase QueD [Candidatus Omnitrophota bacterium]